MRPRVLIFAQSEKTQGNADIAEILYRLRTIVLPRLKEMEFDDDFQKLLAVQPGIDQRILMRYIIGNIHCLL